MKLLSPIKCADLAAEIDAVLIGEGDRMITGINEIHKVVEGDLTFVDVEKYYASSLASAASVILINKETTCPPGKTLLLVGNPFEIYNQLIGRLRQDPSFHLQIAKSAEVHPSAILEPGVVVGAHVKIGANCYIQGNCYIGSGTQIGERVIIDAGTTIGTNAFYFKDYGTHREKWLSGGHVEIDDDVFIGSLCTINRGVSGTTRIGKGSKLDCQVHVGHGVVIGEDCLIAGQVGIGGKTIIGNRVTIYGQAGIAQNLVIADRVTILAKSGIGHNLEEGKTYFGIPATEARERYREMATLRQITRDKTK